MKSFRKFISEEVLPTAMVQDGNFDLRNEVVRDQINHILSGICSHSHVTPYVTLRKVSKALAYFSIILPKKTFMEGKKGVEVYEMLQFGEKMGMNDSGEFIREVPEKYYLFFQFNSMLGMYSCVARVVDKAELDKMLDMAEITMKECADDKATSSERKAVKEPMQDITSDPKKKGNKSAVADSEKGEKAKPVNEELSHGARELTLHADNDQQLHRSSHEPIIKNLSRKHAKGTYDHEKATKLWKYHADRAAKSYEKQHGGKFSVADRKAAAKHFADSARSEHGFGSVKEETMEEGRTTGNRSFKGSPDRKRKAVQMALGRKHKDHPDWNPRTSPQYSALKLGRQLQKQGVKEETLDELSKGTLKAYKSAAKADRKMSKEVVKKGLDTDGKFERSIKNRTKGIDLAKDRLEEKAPPGAKFERMVKHIKKGYSKDGLSAKEKSIAYATAWKAKKKESSE